MSGNDRDSQQHATSSDGLEAHSENAPTAASNRLPAVLLFGMPGTGKGTQGRLLGTMTGLFHVSTGEIFRSMDRSTEDGRLVRDLIDFGNLVPDEAAVRIWHDWVNAAIQSGSFQADSEVLVLDGIPRSVAQCRLLEAHIDVLSVIHLEPEDDEPIVERLLTRGSTDGRADDSTEEIIRRRFEIYRQTTAPVLDFYPSSIVHAVDALGTPIEVKKRILERVIPVIRDRRANAVA
ncbi:MAG: adenylate kinase family protein [Planctomycetota bacterium]|jgi:adenylate kinase